MPCYLNRANSPDYQALNVSISCELLSGADPGEVK